VFLGVLAGTEVVAGPRDEDGKTVGRLVALCEEVCPCLRRRIGVERIERVTLADFPSRIWAYTSSVDSWRKRSIPASVAASSSVCVPSTFVGTKSFEPSIDRSRCDSAAKLTIASTSSRSKLLRVPSRASISSSPDD